MNFESLEDIANHIVSDGKGILADQFNCFVLIHPKDSIDNKSLMTLRN